MLALLIAFGALSAAPVTAMPADACRRSALADQHKDADTIKRLEQAWLTAESRGDVDFLGCLLDEHYKVIVAKKGDTRTKADLLDRVAKNRGATTLVPSLSTTVAINGDYATAYSVMSGTRASGEPYAASYVDFYKFGDGAWKAVAGVDL